MNQLKLRISGMHCSSCEKIIKKALLKFPNISSVEIHNNEIAVIHYSDNLDAPEVIRAIQQAGYDAVEINGELQESTKFKHYLSSLKEKEALEGGLIKIAIATFFILAALEFIAYYGFFITIPGFFWKFGYYLIFVIIAAAICSISVWHIKAYGNAFSCMSGMMIGMTLGMISGFLAGMLVAATNGMFIGSVAGIALGMFLGIFTGKCCGVMGIMEGMMAGLMGGLMGAMTTLMMLNDHLALIIPILVIAGCIILLGLDYMVYKEVRATKAKVNKYSFLPFIIICFIITMALTFLMVYGPKSALFQ